MTVGTWLILSGVAVVAFYVGKLYGGEVAAASGMITAESASDAFARGERFGRAAEQLLIRQARSAAGKKAGETRKRKKFGPPLTNVISIQGTDGLSDTRTDAPSPSTFTGGEGEKA